MDKVGIVSLFYHNWNFGGMLQAYALNWIIDNMGYQSEQVSLSGIETAVDSGTNQEKLRAYAAKYFLTNELRERYHRWRNHDLRKLKNYREFEKHMVQHSKYFGNTAVIADLNKRYTCFVAGSDQIWNTKLFGEQFIYINGLTFADYSKLKIAYAASMGMERLAVGKENIFQKILNGLDAISVRENAARDFLQPLTDKEIAVVLDPTLLLTQQNWDILAVNPHNDSPYIFFYFLLESNNPHDKQARYVAEKLGDTIFCIAEENGRYARPDTLDRQIWDAGPKEFLGYIRDAEMVLTNSFHGTVFSILFHKPFWTFKRHKDQDVASMNARIVDFLTDLGLEDRILEDDECPTAEKLARPIDYERVDKLLEEKRDFSLNWLRQALAGETP